MKHYGDITKLNGADVPPVNVITGGSPCQDLSVAGKRAGLSGERSGLFMEQIRLIREMRENDRKKGRTDESIRPRYMVWENVPGAFSSNGGEDFRAVLEETARTADKNAVIPRLEKGQKWSSSGCILGDGWSIAWRVHDAQFWGVPQRRKRIALVADFAGGDAPEILFERKGLSGDIETSREERQGTATDAEESVGETSIVGFPLGFRAENTKTYDEKATTVCNGTRPGFTCGVICRKKGNPQNAEKRQGWERTEKNDTLNAFGNSKSRTPTIVLENHPNDSRVKISEDGICQTLSSRMGTGGGNVPMVMETSDGDIAGILDASYYKGCGLRQGRERTVVYGISAYDSNAMKSSNPNSGVYAESDTMYTLNSTEHHALCVENHPADSMVQIKEDGVVQTLLGRMRTGGGNVPMAMEPYQNTTGTLSPGAHAGSYNGQDAYNDMLISAPVVRRLTPLECERLQGFPDGWTDIGDWIDSKGKLHKGESDSPRYKALGNSIALPFWEWMAKRMAAYLPENSTMASLFDGIGGFPLVYSRAGVSPIWASEIEEFPIAVTKERFPE